MERSDEMWQTGRGGKMIKKLSHWDGGSSWNNKIIVTNFVSWARKHYKCNQQRNSRPAATIFPVVLSLLSVTESYKC